MPLECWISPDGRLELAPDNHAPNSALLEIDGDGRPEGYQFATPDLAEGIHIYASDPDGPQSTMTRQTLTPLPPDTSSYTVAGPVVKGQQPLRSSLVAGDGPPPPAPSPIAASSGVSGFSGGEYGYLYTFVTPEGLQTSPSGEVRFAVSAGNHIEIPTPSDVPDGCRLGIYLTRPDQPRTTARFQGAYSPRAQAVTLRAFREGRPLPTENETYLGRGPAMRWGRELVSARALHNRQPHTYRFAYSWVTRYGESPASVPSAARVYSARAQRRAFWVAPRRARFASQYRLYVSLDSEWYQVAGPGIAGGLFNFGLREGVRRRLRRVLERFRSRTLAGHLPIYGYTERPPDVLAVRLSQADPPTEDESGIEGPGFGTVPDPPTAVGATLPTPAAYWFGASYVRGGRETVMGPPVRHTIATSEIVTLSLPTPTNLIPNAEFADVGSDGMPLGHDARSGAGTLTAEDGILTLDTGGTLKAANGDYPQDLFPPIPVEPGTNYTASAKIEVNASAGEARFRLVELDAGGSAIKGTDVASVGGTDYAEPAMVFGPNGTALDPAATHLGLRCDMHNPTTSDDLNMVAKFYDVALHPFPTARGIRKMAAGGPNRAANFDPPTSTPYPSGSFGGIGPPSGIPETAASSIASEDFESGSTGVDFSLVSSGDATASVTAGAALSGSYGLYAEDRAATATSGYDSAYLSYSGDSVDGSLAMRARYEALHFFPAGGKSDFIRIMEFNDSSGSDIADIRLYQTGDLRLRYIDGGVSTERGRFANIAAGDVIDLEVVVSGLATSEGEIEVLFGRGEGRELKQSFAGLDFTAFPATGLELRAGGIIESRPGLRWEFNLDDVEVTERGYYTGSSAPTSNPPSPDRPTGADGALRELTPASEIINQAYLLLTPDVAPSSGLGIREADWSVRPNTTYTVAVYGRHTVFAEGQAVHPAVIYALSEDGAEVEVGRLFGNSGASGTSDWADFYTTVDVPEGYTGLTLRSLDMAGGLYVFQEPMLAPGSIMAHADRDAIRDGGREVGPATATIDLEVATPARNPRFTDHDRLAYDLGVDIAEEVASGPNRLTYNQSKAGDGNTTGIAGVNASVVAQQATVIEGDYSFEVTASEGTQRGIDFDGTDDYISFADSTTLMPATSPASVEFMAEVPDASTFQVIFWAGDSSNNAAVIYINSGVLRFRTVEAGVNTDIDYALTAGETGHFSATWDGTNIVVEKDGSQIGSAAVSLTVDAVAGAIGARGSGADKYLGYLFFVRTWGKALTAAEIDDYLWEQLDGTQTDLYALYNFEDAATLGTDESGNNRDGTVNGSPVVADRTAPAANLNYGSNTSPDKIDVPANTDVSARYDFIAPAGLTQRLSIVLRSLDDTTEVGRADIDLTADGSEQTVSGTLAGVGQDTIGHISLYTINGKTGDKTYTDRLQWEHASTVGTWEAGIGDAPTALYTAYKTADTQPELDAAATYSDPDTPERKQWARIRLELSGDGGSTPSVNTAFADFARNVSTLLRADGSSLPGGTIVEDLEDPYTRPDYETDTVSGRPLVVATTPEITRLQPVEILFFSREAAREFEEQCVEGEWVLEDWVGGYKHRIRFYEPVEVEDFHGGVGDYRRYYLYGSAEVGRVEVIESAPLEDPPS